METNYRFLGCSRSYAAYGTVRWVLHIVPLEPLRSGRSRDAEDLGGLTIRQARILDLLPDFRGGTGLRVNA